jgi:hypothetical protein
MFILYGLKLRLVGDKQRFVFTADDPDVVEQIRYLRILSVQFFAVVDNERGGGRFL